MRSIVPNRAKYVFRSDAKCGYTARNFLTGGGRIFLREVGHVPPGVPVLLPTHPSSALIHKIFLYVGHFAVCRAPHRHKYTDLRVLL